MNADPNEVLLKFEKVHYLGGHPDEPQKILGLTVYFQRGGMAVYDRNDTMGFRSSWSAIHAVEALDQTGVRTRVTASRLLVLGAFAFVAPKRSQCGYLIVSDTKSEFIFEVPGMSAVELRAKLTIVQPFIAGSSSQPVLHGASDREKDIAAAPARLRALADLLTQGLITDAEYAERRRIIIESI